MKKILLKVQGINIIADYMTKELKLAQVDLSSYKKVIHIDTEEEFDRILKWLPANMKEHIYARKKIKETLYDNDHVRTKLKWIDYAVDIWAFFANAWIYKRVTEKVKAAADMAIADGYEVDILSHSLGTLISLHSGATINNFFCLASPIGFGVRPVRWIVNSHFNLCKHKLKAIRAIAVYGEKDIVSKDSDGILKKELNKSASKIYVYSVNTGHQMVDIFTALKSEGKYPLLSHWFEN